MKRVIFLLLFLSVGFCVCSQNTLRFTSPTRNYERGIEFYELKQYEASRQEFIKYLENQESHPFSQSIISASYYVVVTSLYLGYPESEVIAQRFINNYGDHPLAGNLYPLLGKYFFEQKEFLKAIPILEKVITLSLPTEEMQFYNFALGYSYLQTNKVDKAKDQFLILKGLGENKYTSAANYYLGIIFFREQNFNKAIENFQLIENDSAFRVDVVSMLSHSYYREKKYKELNQLVDKTIKNPQGVPLNDITKLVAEVNYTQENYEKAAQYYAYQRKNAPSLFNSTANYRYAHSLFKINKYKEAAEQFKTLISLRDSISQFASYYWGISELQQKKYSDALHAFDVSKEMNYNSKIKEDAGYAYAKLKFTNSSNEEAVKELKNFLNKNPESRHEGEAHQLVTEAYFKTKNYEQALQHIENSGKQTKEINENYQKIAFNQAVMEYGLEKYNQAIVYFDKSISRPENKTTEVQAQFWKAESFSALGKYEEAEKKYGEIIKNNKIPALTELSLYGLGYCQYHQKQCKKAIETFKRFLNESKNNNKSTDAYLRIADCYTIEGEVGQALEFYEKAYQKGGSGRDYALYQKGKVSMAKGKSAEANQAFEQLIQGFPNSNFTPQANFDLGLLNLGQDNYKQALAKFNLIIKQGSNSKLVAEALLQRAITYTNMGENDRALQDYKQLLNNYPNSKTSETALLGIQEVLATTNRSEEFNTFLQTYKKNNPGAGSTQTLEIETCKSIFVNQKYDQAIECFETFTQNYPQNNLVYDAQYYIGESYLSKSDDQKAISFYNQIVTEQKSLFTNRAAMRLGDIYLKEKKYSEAKNMFLVAEKHNSLEKDNITTWLGLAESNYHTASYTEALVYVQKIRKENNMVVSGESRASLLAGKIALQQKKYTLARQELNSTISQGRDSFGAEAKYWIANSYVAEKKYKEAIKTIQEMNTEFENYEFWRAKAFFVMSDIYLAQNNSAQAKQILTSIIQNIQDSSLIEEAKNRLEKIK